MAKRNKDDEKNPFGDDYQKIIEQNRRRKELGVDENNEVIKRPVKIAPNKSGNAAKKASTEMRKKTASKKTARLEALKFIKRTGKIPASPTR